MVRRGGEAATAGAVYAVIAFVVGFVFGTIRFLIVTPIIGETAAVVLEAPVMAGRQLVRLLLVRLPVRCAAPDRRSIDDGDRGPQRE